MEVRAHIRQEDFVGISSVKGAEPSPLKVRRRALACGDRDMTPCEAACMAGLSAATAGQACGLGRGFVGCTGPWTKGGSSHARRPRNNTQLDRPAARLGV